MARYTIPPNSAAPDELGIARDPRQLGVAIRQIVLWQERVPIVVESSDPALSNGFHDFDPDNNFRWTNGNAALPDTILAMLNIPCEIELHIGCTARYPFFSSADIKVASSARTRRPSAPQSATRSGSTSDGFGRRESADTVMNELERQRIAR
jgi:hypothetical protein